VNRSCLLFAFALGLCGCGGSNRPCFGTYSPDEPSWLPHQTLEWEIDAMAAIPGAPKTGKPPSDEFVRAQRDLKTEFWIDAAKGLLAVERGDTGDDRGVRQVAQYQLGVALYRLHYYAEAKRIFRMVADMEDHPMHREAYDWMQRPSCG